jgi:hypothetical protein
MEDLRRVDSKEFPVTETIRLTERQKLLIRYIQGLDKQKRHILTILCRGTEPWVIKEHVMETKIELVPGDTKR